MASFIPCYVFGKNAESVGESCLLCALLDYVPVLNIAARVHVRGKIRDKKGIHVSCSEEPISYSFTTYCGINELL